MTNLTNDRTLCCSDTCEKRFECGRSHINHIGTHYVEDYSSFGTGTHTGHGCEIKYWCGKLGDYKMFEQIEHEWVKLFKQAPPINEDVELKVLYGEEERIYINRLIHMWNGQYVWAYCDYNDCDEVVAWRKRPLKT